MKEIFAFLLTFFTATTLSFSQDNFSFRSEPGFTENKGQWGNFNGEKIYFIGEWSGMRAIITQGGIKFIQQKISSQKPSDIKEKFSSEILSAKNDFSIGELKFPACRTAAVIKKSRPVSGVKNYFLPQCPQGITGVRTYSELSFEEISPGVTLRLSAEKNSITMNFSAENHEAIQRISFEFSGENLRPLTNNFFVSESSSGTISVNTKGGFLPVKEKFPRKNSLLSSNEKITLSPKNDANITDLSAYISWSTFYGGTGSEVINSVCVDKDQNIISTGYTSSSDLQASNYIQPGNVTTPENIFVAKHTNSGELLWATYFGGSNNDYATDIACDAGGNLYISGFTYSSDVPLKNQWQAINRGNRDALFAKLNSSGSVDWATYFGGSGRDEAYGIAVHDTNVVFCGMTTSQNLEVTSGAQQSQNRGAQDAFIVRANLTGKKIFSTYFGGSGDDYFLDVDIDSQGNIYAAGATSSEGIASERAIQNDLDGADDGLITKFNSEGKLELSTYFGGNSNDLINSIKVDWLNNIIIAGTTSSTLFLPIYKAFQPKFGDSAFSTTHNDGFIAKLTSDGILNWSTYKGGDAGDDFYNSAIDLQNNIYVLGRSASENFATGGPGNWQNSGEYDIAISKISPDGKQTYSTLIGGSRGEVAYAIAVDSTNNVVIAGQTDSQDLPIINKQSGYKGFTYDAFLMKLGSCSIARPQISPSNKISLCAGDSVFLSAPTGFTNYRWSNGKSARQIWVKDSGSYTVTITGDDGCTSISLPTQVSIITITQPTISGRSKICFADTTRLFLSGNYSSYKWSTGDTSASIFVNSPGTYSVTAIHMQSGCKVLSQPFALEILPLFMPKIIAPKLKIADGETIEIQADGNYKTYLWSTGFTTKRLFVNSPGKYFYFAQDQNGCEAVSDTIVIEKISSVEENFSQGIFLSPNPVSNILNLSLNSSPAAQTKISICNIFGETIAVICDGDSEKKNFVWIPEPQRSSGMYLVKVSDRSGVKFFPFILEK